MKVAISKIKLTQGKFALVDAEDFNKLNKFKWYAFNNNGRGYYAVRHSSTKQDKKRKLIRMHNIIMNPPVGFIVDHMNGDGLNNQKSNLRVCNNLENIRNTKKTKRNTSGFKGVSREKSTNKWKAQIRVGGALFYLGLFTSKLKAYEVYCEACVKYHGEFARLK